MVITRNMAKALKRRSRSRSAAPAPSTVKKISVAATAGAVKPSKREKRVKKPKPDFTPREKRVMIEEQRRKLAIKKALKTQKKVIKDSAGGMNRARKIRTTIRFKRPRTFRPPRTPRFPRKAVPKRNRMDVYTVIDYPVATESAMKKIEDQNTLVFIIHPKANKIHVKAAVIKMFNVGVKKVNTLVRPDGKKKAYVKLTPDCDALDVANKLGII